MLALRFQIKNHSTYTKTTIADSLLNLEHLTRIKNCYAINLQSFSVLAQHSDQVFEIENHDSLKICAASLLNCDYCMQDS